MNATKKQTQHTAEPWTNPDGSEWIYGQNEEGETAVAQPVGDTAEEAIANARRIVACVNACAGVGTQLLEDTESFADVLTNEATLTEQRDELAAALQEMHDAASSREFERSMGKPSVDGLRRFTKACMAARAGLSKVQP